MIAACGHRQLGLIDNWLRHIKDIYIRHQAELDAIDDTAKRENRLCELNVVEQVKNVCLTTIVQNAWAQGAILAVHGLVYGLHDGLLRDLDVCAMNSEKFAEIYRLDPRG